MLRYLLLKGAKSLAKNTSWLRFQISLSNAPLRLDCERRNQSQRASADDPSWTFWLPSPESMVRTMTLTGGLNPFSR